jgi:hypothetical protein
MISKSTIKGVALGLTVGVLAAAFAHDDKAQPEMQLPPGWTMEDVQACMAAGQPGSQHEKMQAMAGTWKAKNQMWMAPETEAMVSEGEWKCSGMFGGRYMKTEVKGEMPGMGT